MELEVPFEIGDDALRQQALESDHLKIFTLKVRQHLDICP
jgi:hypothetical protein